MVKQEKKVVQEVEPPELPRMETHLFPDAFLHMMNDYAYETLRQHLRATAQVNTEAMVLLEDLIILHQVQLVYCQNAQVADYWNQTAAQVVGNISQAVVKLGGYFNMAPTNMIK
jgi:hypothetical protein